MNLVETDAYNVVKAVLKTDKSHLPFAGLGSLDSHDMRIVGNVLIYW